MPTTTIGRFVVLRAWFITSNYFFVVVVIIVRDVVSAVGNDAHGHKH